MWRNPQWNPNGTPKPPHNTVAWGGTPNGTPMEPQWNPQTPTQYRRRGGRNPQKILLTHNRKNEVFRRQTEIGQTYISIFTRSMGKQRKAGRVYGTLLWFFGSIKKYDGYRYEKDSSKRLSC